MPPNPGQSSTIPADSDLLRIDDQLDEEERLVRDTVRKFAADRILPHIADWFEAGTLPPRSRTRTRRARPVRHAPDRLWLRGRGRGRLRRGVPSVEAADSGLRSMVPVQGSLAMFPIWKYGSDEQKQEWLPRMAAGQAIGCFGLTEPDGSDPGGMRTSARRDGTDWILNGTKMWITNGSVADVAVVWARTDEGIRGFLVPRGTRGFTARSIGKKLSLRASVTSQLNFDDARLPAAAVLDNARGLGGPLACLSEARYGIAWGATGAARNCFEAAVEYARTREQFGKPIGAFQLTQGKLAWMLADLARAQLLALHLGRLKEAGEVTPQQVSLGKMANVRAAIEIARQARTILGASGISLEYPVMRHAANLESVLTYEGTEEIHMLVLGEAITGIPAYR